MVELSGDRSVSPFLFPFKIVFVAVFSIEGSVLNEPIFISNWREVKFRVLLMPGESQILEFRLDRSALV